MATGISLAGKQGVVVMINDKITRLSADAVVDRLAAARQRQSGAVEELRRI